MPESQAFINARGIATIRFRLTEVSANHRKQPFCILVCVPLARTVCWSLKNFPVVGPQVGPDREKSPLNSDIAPTISTPVIVRSKKPKVWFHTREKLVVFWFVLTPSTYLHTETKESTTKAEKRGTATCSNVSGSNSTITHLPQMLASSNGFRIRYEYAKPFLANRSVALMAQLIFSCALMIHLQPVRRFVNRLPTPSLDVRTNMKNKTKWFEPQRRQTLNLTKRPFSSLKILRAALTFSSH